VGLECGVRLTLCPECFCGFCLFLGYPTKTDKILLDREAIQQRLCIYIKGLVPTCWIACWILLDRGQPVDNKALFVSNNNHPLRGRPSMVLATQQGLGEDNQMNRNKQRGYELEKETADFWKANGVEARRVFASGAYARLGEEFEGDVKLANRYRIEAKRKKRGFKFLYQSLDQAGGSDMIVVREDRNRRLYVMEEDTVLDLLRLAGLVSETKLG
jgi:hypothetical protein